MKKKNINGIYGYWKPFCEICGKVSNDVSSYKELDMYVCGKHRVQYDRYGKFLQDTRIERNKYKMSDCGTYATIYLSDKTGTMVAETIVDIEYLDIALQYRLHCKKSNRENGVQLMYAIAKINNKNVRLHHLIMNDKNYDHVNNNGLDNRLSNLRKITVSKNGMNKRRQSNNSTGVVGVVSRESDNTSPWIPQIKINGKMTRLGTEYSFDEAVKKRLKSEADLFKTYSNNYNHDTQTIQLTYHSHDDNKQTFIESNLQGDIIKFEKL